ncbi:MAG: SpoIIE family protein phosphatase, partial [Chloroflexaceae bacterium]|nr:SpoIIE family protein phosphatase [Chloroflexaceae bacterium]
IALLIIGTYRSNEVGPGHPLRLTLQALQEASISVQELALEPLDTTGLGQLLADTLHCSPEEVGPLIELIGLKTGGNPFFVAEFLKLLASRSLLAFNHNKSCWQWDIAQIQAQEITDNVVDLLAHKVQQLSAAARSALRLAACIGHQFRLDTLALIADLPAPTLAGHLEEAIAMGLVVPLSNTYRLMTLDVPGLSTDVTVEYGFAHDRIQQVVYEHIPTDERTALHWHIGTLLLEEAQAARLSTATAEPTTLREDKLFDIVDHLNRGRAIARTQESRDMLATLNLTAGSRAREAAAYEPAFNYLQTGLELLGETGWEEHYEVALQLHTYLASAAYLTGDTATLDRMANAVIAHARTPLDTIDIYDTIVQAQAARHQFREAIDTLLPVLAQLGVALPAEPTMADSEQRLAAIQELLNSISIEQILYLPRMEDPQKLAAMRVLASLFSLAYIGAPAMMPLVVFEQVVLSLRHGNASSSPFAYANYALLLCSMLNDIPTGARFGTLALRLLEHLDTHTFKAKTLVTVNFFVSHWTQPAHHTLPSLLEGYRSGLETGDFEYGGYAAYMYTCHAFLVGRELAELTEELAMTDETLAQLQQERSRHVNGLYRQVVRNLIEAGPTPTIIQGPFYNEEQSVPLLQAANDIPALANIFYCKMLLSYLLEEYTQAATCARQLEQYLVGFTGSLYMPLFYFFDSLIELARLGDNRVPSGAVPALERSMLDKVAVNQAQLAQWAEHGPANCAHRWYLVEAELARVEGRDSDAWDAYDRAIELAQEHHYLHETALANQLAGRFFFSRGRIRIAVVYLRDAHYDFRRWGATAKVRLMETQYPWLTSRGESTLTTRSTITLKHTEPGRAEFDLMSVFKAYQTISGEIVLETLLARLMQTLIENAGAERGLLVLEHAGRWVIEAEGRIGSENVTVLQSVPLETAPVPLTVINYVARTRESVVLNDARIEGDFTRDNYIMQQQPRAVLCTPLLHQGKLTGMLYLENNQTAGAFTADRLEVLNLLSGQAAISIENAHLYAHLEDLVSERTAELSKAYQTVKNLNERLQSELNLARNIQHSLLPSPRPGWHTLDVMCYTASAREVGGDLYAYEELGSEQYVLAIGDVSGKGMPAALLMAVTVAVFRSSVRQRMEPGLALKQMDLTLADYTRTTRQNCAFLYVDIERLMPGSDRFTVRVANAGCIAPMVKRRNGDVVWIYVGGVPLGTGLGARTGYQAMQLEMQPGDMVILTTDGVVEAENNTRLRFGFERLERAVQQGPQHSAEAMLRHLRSAVGTFVGPTEPHDDLTIVVIRV